MKKLEIDALIGYTVLSHDKDGTIITKEGKKFDVQLWDQNYGCNDSHAFFKEFNLDDIIGEKILGINQGEADGDGAKFILKTKSGTGIIEIIHESNGYYGWDYEVIETNL